MCFSWGCPPSYLRGEGEFHRAGPLLVLLSLTPGSLLSSRSSPGLEGEGENKAWLFSIRLIPSYIPIYHLQSTNPRTVTYWTAELNFIEKLYAKIARPTWYHGITGSLQISQKPPRSSSPTILSPLAFTKYLFLQQFYCSSGNLRLQFLFAKPVYYSTTFSSIIFLELARLKYT